jgi:thymidylate synthase (FAD)
MDKLMRVEVLAKTDRPQFLTYLAMHQDYASKYVYEEFEDDLGNPELTDDFYGRVVVNRLLKGNRGHYGPLEHPSISFACGYIPHSVMQQMRTHRVGISFDVQSFRYTSESILNVVGDASNNYELVEKAFYLRPVGDYADRNGGKFHYSESHRHVHLNRCVEAAVNYKLDTDCGMPEEQARGMLPFDYRQHFVMTVNARSLMHLLDLRAKKDAQPECQWLCDLILPHFRDWCLEIAEWYISNRLHKALLAP